MLSLNRPKTFDDIAGHTAMIGEFKNRAEIGNFPQVMIFEGPSGSGKTSIALIISALLNCKNPQVDKPCGECSSCKDIWSERFQRDIMFLDASNMGKDDVLKLREVTSIAPMRDANRVIIIDEAQELSKAGKGATLKLLEKPRKNMYFILCTMDSLDKAIGSRGQKYTFKPVDSFSIAEHLYHTVIDSGEEVPEEFFNKGIFIISENAMGNVRQAIQLLERCIYGKYFTEKEIVAELGVMSFSQQVDLLSLLLKRDPKFMEIPKDQVKQFFYYSWKILLDAKKLKTSGFVDAGWKRVRLEEINESSNLDDLLNTYNDIYYHHSYFNTDNVFWHFILKYWGMIPIIHKKTGRQIVG